MSDIEDHPDTLEAEPQTQNAKTKAPAKKVDRRREAAVKNLEKAREAKARKRLERLAQEAEAKAKAAEKKTSRSRRKVEQDSDYSDDDQESGSDSGEAEFELIPVSKSRSRVREHKPERKIARRSRREPSPEPTPGYDYDSGDESAGSGEDIPPALARAMSKFFTKAMAKKSDPVAKPKKSKSKASPTVVNHIHVPAQSDQAPKKESKPKNDSTAALRKLMFG